MKHIWQATKCGVFISLLSLVLPLQATRIRIYEVSAEI